MTPTVLRLRVCTTVPSSPRTPLPRTEDGGRMPPSVLDAFGGQTRTDEDGRGQTKGKGTGGRAPALASMLPEAWELIAALVEPPRPDEQHDQGDDDALDVWRERVRATCPACGCASIGRGGVCSVCGASKGPPKRPASPPTVRQTAGGACFLVVSCTRGKRAAVRVSRNTGKTSGSPEVRPAASQCVRDALAVDLVSVAEDGFTLAGDRVVALVAVALPHARTRAHEGRQGAQLRSVARQVAGQEGTEHQGHEGERSVEGGAGAAGEGTTATLGSHAPPMPRSGSGSGSRLPVRWNPGSGRPAGALASLGTASGASSRALASGRRSVTSETPCFPGVP
jgi:hypothetical protein